MGPQKISCCLQFLTLLQATCIPSISGYVTHDVATTSAVQVEEHMVDGKMKQLLVHRKGSTRAFPPHHPLIPVDYQLTGQPVLIGGTMGTNSYVLTGGLRSCPIPPRPL